MEQDIEKMLNENENVKAKMADFKKMCEMLVKICYLEGAHDSAKLIKQGMEESIRMPV